MARSERECLAALREAAKRLGKSPTKAEYEALGLTPASGTIIRVVGGWNEAKEKAELETFQQSEFGGTEVQPKPAGVEIPDDTEWESLTAQQRWYYENREHRIAVKEQRREALKQWFHELKRDELTCDRCGEGTPPALEFHHDGEKSRDVSEMVAYGHAKSEIRREIDRCVVLCANCHRKEHDSGPDPEELPPRSEIAAAAREAPKQEARRLRRQWVVAYKHDSEGCGRCSESAPACLDFHHSGEKSAEISRLISSGRPLAEIRGEIVKCELLCANCHRQEHFDPPAAEA